MSRYFQWLMIIFSANFVFLSTNVSANTVWLPNVVHYINHSPAVVPREPVLQLPNESLGGSFAINWSTFDENTYNFLLQYKLIGTAEWVTLYQGNNTSFNFSNVSIGGDYNLRLSCTDSVGCPIVDYIEHTISVVLAPQTPLLAISTELIPTNNSFTISFPAVAQTNEYQVFENGLLVDTILNDIEITMVSLNKIKPLAGDYSYQIKACNAVGCSDLSLTTKVTAYTAASQPSAPTTSSKAYSINTSFQVQWPEENGLTYEYFSTTQLPKEATLEQIHQHSFEVLKEETFQFSEIGYVWFFAKACDVTGACSEYGTAKQVQIFSQPIDAPANFLVSMYGEVIDDNAKVVSIPLNEKFVLHWSSSNEVAPSTIGKYKLAVNGGASGTIYGTAGYLKVLYPDGGFHKDLTLTTAGKYVYTIKACNLTGTTPDDSLDCSPESRVIVYAGMPIPLTLPPEAPINHVSVSLYGETVDSTVKSISVESGEKFVLHWGQSYELEPTPIGSYSLTENGQDVMTIYGVSGYLKRLYPDSLFHRERVINTPGTYQYTLAGCNHNGDFKDCGPESSSIEVNVYGPPIQPVNQIQGISVSAYGAPVVNTKKSLLIAKDEKFVLHWQLSNEVSQSPIGSYSVYDNKGINSSSIYGVSGYLKTLYPDGEFHREFTYNTTGNYQYTILACNRVNEERLCGPKNTPIKVSVYDSFSVFNNVNGDLFVKLSNTHSNKLLKLSLVDNLWEVTETTQTQWDALSLTLSDYRLEYDNFSGDNLQDFRLTSNNSATTITVEQKTGSYQISTEPNKRKIILIHTDLLGTTGS